MDNYLNHRWPKGPGIQPPPVPTAVAAQPAGQKRRRSPRRWIVSIVCVVLCLALLGGISFWAVNGIVGLLSSAQLPNGSEDAPPRRSWSLPDDRSDWTLDDLPWGEPDPSVQLSVAPAEGAVLSGRDIHEQMLPSIVYVEAQERSRFGLSVHSGTGIVVTQSGYVLTNYHVIDETNVVQVMLLTDLHTYYDAEVIGVDEKFDVAVLKIEAEGLVPATLGDSDALAVGDRVYAEGNPMGYLLGSMTDGIVSALDRDEDDSGMGMIQTSAALNPGNSGGALVNEWGQVVGITSAKITGLERESGDSIENAAVIENLGLAIPTSDILPFINRIIATGESWRPAIGITCSEAVADGWHGVQVKAVTDGVPAQEAGLREDDLIVSANGMAVTTLAELRRVIYRTGVDGMLHCVVVRDGQELSISFALIDMPEEQE